MATNTNNIYTSIIGSGVLFPIELNLNDNGKVGWYPVEGNTKLIDNNLEALLLYQLGERFREENFGTRLWECIEEGNTQAQAYLINAFMKEAISTWEERITYKGTSITRDGSKLNIEFTYVINDTNISNVGTITYDASNNSLNI